MTLWEKIIDTLGDIRYEILPFSYGFLGMRKSKKIKFADNMPREDFHAVFKKLIAIFGEPIYVHESYGFIWNADGKYFAYGIISESYNYEVPEILLFKGSPFGKKLDYTQYSEIDKAVKRGFEKRGFRLNGCLNYGFTGFIYIVNNDTAECMFYLKKKSAEFYYCALTSMENNTRKMIPRYNKKYQIGYSSPERIENLLNECFENR